MTRTAMCGKVETSVMRRSVSASEGVLDEPGQATYGMRITPCWLLTRERTRQHGTDEYTEGTCRSIRKRGGNVVSERSQKLCRPNTGCHGDACRHITHS